MSKMLSGHGKKYQKYRNLDMHLTTESRFMKNLSYSSQFLLSKNFEVLKSTHGRSGETVCQISSKVSSNLQTIMRILEKNNEYKSEINVQNFLQITAA